MPIYAPLASKPFGNFFLGGGLVILLAGIGISIWVMKNISVAWGAVIMLVTLFMGIRYSFIGQAYRNLADMK